MTPPTPDPLPALTPRLILRAYGAAAAATVLVTLGWAHHAYPPPYLGAVAAGWLVAAGNAAAALGIIRLGVGGSLTRFLTWALCANLLRAAILVAIIVCLHELDMATFRPFQSSLWVGYFSTLAAEVLALHFGSVGGTEESR